MLVVETIARIRRAHFVQGKALEAICRELKVSRKVVRKVSRSGDTEFVYERRVQPPPLVGCGVPTAPHSSWGRGGASWTSC